MTPRYLYIIYKIKPIQNHVAVFNYFIHKKLVDSLTSLVMLYLERVIV